MKRFEENIPVMGEMAKNFNAEDAEIRRKARYNFFKGAEGDLTVFDPSV